MSTTVPTRTAPGASGAAAPRPPAAFLEPGVLLAAVAAGGAGVLALWWTGTDAVVGADGWLTGAGRITGLLAGYTCAILVLLVARVPAIDRGAGTDRLARWHAYAGRCAISLVLAHALLITWGYALTTHTDVLTQTGTLVVDYPDMILTTIGFGLLVATGVVSARAARRRLRYETWHLLHLATYAALYLAFWHQLALGNDFLGNRAARVAWYVLYGGVAALVLWYRVLVPLRTGLRHRLRIAAVREEAPGIVSLYITGRHVDELQAQPGQFLRWRVLARGLWHSAHPYSLSAPPSNGTLRITVQAAGPHSTAFASLAPGTRVWAEGPYGALTGRHQRSGKVLLIAGGVGITPLRALLETLPGRITLIYRARTEAEVAFRGEIDTIAARRGATVHYVVGRPEGQPAGSAWPFHPDLLTRALPDLAEHDVYVCGPDGMAEAAIAAIRKAGVPRSRIHHESFAL
ncbi:ferredoxin reductase family protein [Uniformispora flossi]|uniref:ferredoxin reductase family protein n=1 Tax=Uniformispora flossi TaxID=3390723 RepID=UPI003C2CF366